MSIATARLSDIAILDRTSLKPEEIPNETKYLGLEHVESGGKILNYQIVQNGDLASSKFKFSPNHILYGKLRPYLAKIASPDFAGICSTDIIPILPTEKIEKNYLLHFLRQSSMVEFANSQSTGANLPRLSPKSLANFEIPLPPLPEQKRIAGILDQADALRRQRQRALGQLNQLGQSIFYEMFGEPRVNPKEFSIVAAKDVINVQGGYAFKSKGYLSDGIPVVRIGEVNSAFDKDMVFHPRVDSLKRFILRPKDLVMSLTGTVGKDDYGNLTEVPDTYSEYYLNQRVARISSKTDTFDMVFFKYLLSDPWMKTQLIKNNRGIRQANISNGDVLALQIPQPPSKLQERFAELIRFLDSKRLIISNQLLSFETLFASLQHRAFRGEL